MKTDSLFETRYLMFRDKRGQMKPVTMTRFMAESTFTPEENDRLLHGLPVDTDSGRWADMVVLTNEMLTHWDETP